MKKNKISTWILLALMLLTTNTLSAQLPKGDVIDSAVIKGGVLWEVGTKGYDGFLELIKTPDYNVPDMCNVVRVSFTRRLESWEKDEAGKRQDYTYMQKWTVDVDTLEEIATKSTYKIYEDGFFLKDTVRVKREYRLRGPLLGEFYNYTTLQNVPLPDKKNKTRFSTSSYIPVTEYFYQLVKSLSDEWPIVKIEEVDSDEFELNNIYRSGPDKEFTLRISNTKSGKVLVASETMTVNIYENGKLANSLSYKKKDDPKICQITDKNNQKWTALYPDGDKSDITLQFNDYTLVINQNGEKRYLINMTPLTEALELAQKRGIITKPESRFD